MKDDELQKLKKQVAVWKLSFNLLALFLMLFVMPIIFFATLGMGWGLFATLVVELLYALVSELQKRKNVQ